MTSNICRISNRLWQQEIPYRVQKNTKIDDNPPRVFLNKLNISRNLMHMWVLSDSLPERNTLAGRISDRLAASIEPFQATRTDPVLHHAIVPDYVSHCRRPSAMPKHVVACKRKRNHNFTRDYQIHTGTIKIMFH